MSEQTGIAIRYDITEVKIGRVQLTEPVYEFFRNVCPGVGNISGILVAIGGNELFENDYPNPKKPWARQINEIFAQALAEGYSYLLVLKPEVGV